MKLLWIEITNFRTFSVCTRLEFPQTPGLYSMQGANGAGKSSVWDALCWCLFEKTTRGLKASNVCNWAAGKGAVVSVCVASADGTRCRVERTWSPNSWKLVHEDGTCEDLAKGHANPILAELALQYSSFLNCVLIAQSAPMFLDLKHDAQASLFSDIMGLDTWLVYSDAASTTAQLTDIKLRSAEREVARLQGMFDAPQDYSAEVAQYEASRRERIEDLEKAYVKSLYALRIVKEEHAQTARAAGGAGCNCPSSEQIKEAAQAAQQTRDVQVALQTQLADIDILQDTLERESTCPTCNQVLPTHTRDQNKVNNNSRRKRDIAADHARAVHLYATAQTKLKALVHTRDAWDASQKQAQRCAGRVLAAEQVLDVIEDKVEACQAEENPYAKLQSNAVQRIQEHKQALGSAIRASQRLAEQVALYSFWVKGFKDVRLQLIDSALAELEIEVNSVLGALGLTGWEITFEVDRVTKGGSMQRGFNAQVFSPKMQKSAPWESWSGGEGQRLRIAVTMGLANLIRSKTGCNLNLEVWDEPSVALSAEGVQAMLSKLAERAQQEGRVIWVTDHTSRSFARFAGVCVAEKHTTGSTLKMIDE